MQDALTAYVCGQKGGIHPWPWHYRISSCFLPRQSQAKTVHSSCLQFCHCAATYRKPRKRREKFLTSKFWPQNSHFFSAFSFHLVATGRNHTWSTLAKYTFLRGLLDYMYALCLTLSTDKTSVGRSRGWAFSWQYLSEEVTISCISRQGPEVIQDVKWILDLPWRREV